MALGYFWKQTWNKRGVTAEGKAAQQYSNNFLAVGEKKDNFIITVLSWSPCQQNVSPLR